MASSDVLSRSLFFSWFSGVQLSLVSQLRQVPRERQF